MLFTPGGLKLDNHAPDATRACAMAKRYVTDSCFAVANEALQIHGGIWLFNRLWRGKNCTRFARSPNPRRNK